ncbi:MAG: hypothetical protein P8X95_01860 [Anaerolineales bacterium]
MTHQVIDARLAVLENGAGLWDKHTPILSGLRARRQILPFEYAEI